MIASESLEVFSWANFKAVTMVQDLSMVLE